jgi:hypothetical protein
MRSFVLRLCVVVAAFFGAGSALAEIAMERSVNSARVVRVVQTAAADLVLIDNGQDAGFRQGMVCFASRDGEPIGEILLVDLRLRAASGLILELSPGVALRPGDVVAVKTVSSRK